MKAKAEPSAIDYDTREQRPRQIGKREMRIATLPFGDYRLSLFPSELVIEMKNFGDACSTLTMGHDRFMREIDRAQAARVPLVVVAEGTVEDVRAGRYFGFPGIKPQAILGAVRSVVSRGVPWLWCGSREQAKAMASDLFDRAERHALERRRSEVTP